MRARRKTKRRRARRRSAAPEEGRQVAAKGSLRAKGQRRERRSFQWPWPPPASNCSLPSTTMWKTIAALCSSSARRTLCVLPWLATLPKDAADACVSMWDYHDAACYC
ncbi:unnamed protein product [Musa acuminata var. zebrina]